MSAISRATRTWLRAGTGTGCATSSRTSGRRQSAPCATSASARRTASPCPWTVATPSESSMTAAWAWRATPGD
eukprot:13174295-Alexandrium_andersonii.AAC.1